jgi:hypothetical protein
MSTSRVVRVPADDGIRNCRLFQRSRHPFQPLLNFFHSSLHAPPQRFAGQVEWNRRRVCHLVHFNVERFYATRSRGR